MSRARILADYVSSGDELADKAPLASPAFTGTPTGITAAHLEAGVLPSDVTGGSGLTALGTVTAGNISNADIVYPVGHIVKIYHKVFKDRQAISRVSGNDTNNISDSEFILIGTGASGTSGDPLTITTDIPASSASKFLIQSSVHTSGENSNSMFLRFYSGSSFISDSGGLADVGIDTSMSFGKSHLSVGGSDYGVMNFSGSYLWSPSSASAQTISVRGMGYASNKTSYINEGVNTGNQSYQGTATSYLTVMEVI